MKILIGTPIHQIKDYAMERWLENVAKLLKKFPADLLLVDNSPNLDYIETVKKYLAKYGIKNYQIEHLEIGDQQGRDEKIARSREIIRQEILSKGYDAWFSWESDQLIPPDSLDRLVEIMEKGNFMIVLHTSLMREYPSEPNNYFGCALVRRAPLEKYSFIPNFGHPGVPNGWYRGEDLFKKQVLDGGGNYIEISGVFEYIHHLNE